MSSSVTVAGCSRERGLRVEARAVDVTSRRACTQLVDDVVAAHARINVLVNNGGAAPCRIVMRFNGLSVRWPVPPPSRARLLLNQFRSNVSVGKEFHVNNRVES
jgi:NAD(P)-dependent dehydrogenase (short-subunit alcohol dehydrogenase family)